MFWITFAAIIMSIIAFKLGVVTVLAAVMFLVIKSVLLLMVLITGALLWRWIRGKRQIRLQGGTYESHR